MTGHHLAKRPPRVRTYIPESGINFGADRYVFSKSIALGVMMINQIEIVKVPRKRVPDAMRPASSRKAASSRVTATVSARLRVSFAAYVTSALAPNADIPRCHLDVRFGQ
jgi:hypothetical protein